jgi:hypothetical protein
MALRTLGRSAQVDTSQEKRATGIVLEMQGGCMYEIGRNGLPRQGRCCWRQIEHIDLVLEERRRFVKDED